MAFQQLTQENTEAVIGSVERLMNTAVRSGIKELQISGYDKLNISNSPALAAYVSGFVSTFQKIMEV